MKSKAWVLMLANRTDLSDTAKWLATLLYHQANGVGGWWGESYETLMRQTGCGYDKVNRALNELLEAGLLKKTPGHCARGGLKAKTSEYSPTWPESGSHHRNAGVAGQECSAFPGCDPSIRVNKGAEDRAPLSQEKKKGVTLIDALLAAGFPAIEKEMGSWRKFMSDARTITGWTGAEVIAHWKLTGVRTISDAMRSLPSLPALERGNQTA